MSESFAQLFEESLHETPMVPGTVILGTVIRVNADHLSFPLNNSVMNAVT